jgi:hypothetical protein
VNERLRQPVAAVGVGQQGRASRSGAAPPGLRSGERASRSGAAPPGLRSGERASRSGAAPPGLRSGVCDEGRRRISALRLLSGKHRQVVPGTAGPGGGAVGRGQRVQVPEHLTQPAKPAVVADRGCALRAWHAGHELGDQHGLPVEDGQRFGGHPSFRLKALHGEEPQDLRVACGSILGPCRGKDPCDPRGAVGALDSVHAEVKLGQAGDCDPIPGLEVACNDVAGRPSGHPAAGVPKRDVGSQVCSLAGLGSPAGASHAVIVAALSSARYLVRLSTRSSLLVACSSRP